MRTEPVQVYISLGSNLGHREENLKEGIRRLNKVPGTSVTRVSSLYSTGPIGYLEQADFLNAAAELACRLEPLEILRQVQLIENEMGRVRTIRWGPRVIDLDILFYGNETFALPELQIPHPRIAERAFVMVPLAELNPDLQIQGVAIVKKVQETANQKICLSKRNWFGTL